MSGISSKAAGGLENKKGFNGQEKQSKEFSDGSGLEWMDFTAKVYDPGLEGFLPKTLALTICEGGAPYEFAFDNPGRYADPEGLSGEDPAKKKPLDVSLKGHQPKHQPASKPEPPHKQQTQPSQRPAPQQQQNPKPQDEGNSMPNNVTPPPISPFSPEEKKEEQSDPLIKAITVTGMVSEMAEIGVEKGGKLAEAAATGTTETEIITQLEDLGKLSKTTAKVFGVIGNVAGVITTVEDWKEAIDKPTIGHYTKAISQTIVTGFSVVGRSNPIITTLLVVSDLTGFTDYLFDKF